MNVRKIIAAALMVSPGITSAALYVNAIENQKNQSTINIAVNFLKNGATFRFDGIEGSIAIIDSYSMEGDPVQHVVVISFDTAHAGWGDREDTFIAQVITNHVIKITIVEGEVLSAVLDDVWDEINQEQVIPECLVLEEVRDIALEYVAEQYQLEFPENWASEVTTLENYFGASTIRYTDGDWSVSIKYPVVGSRFRVSIENTVSGFSWSGLVTSSGEVSEQ